MDKDMVDLPLTGNVSHACQVFQNNTLLWECVIARKLYQYVSPIILFLGLTGNVMSFVIFSTTSQRYSIFSFLLRILSVVDSFVLCSSLTRFWIIGQFDVDIRTINIVACRMDSFLLYASSDMSGWVLSVVAVERLIAVAQPHKHQTLFNKKTVTVTLICISLSLIAVNCPMFFMLNINLKILGNDTTQSCSGNDSFKYLYYKVWPFMDMLVFCIIPFTIISLSNLSIIYNILKFVSRRNIISSANQQGNRVSSVTITLLLVSFVYLVCTFPIVLLNVIWDNGAKTLEESAMRKLYFNLADLLWTLNCSINFLLYCVTGPDFRKELMKMFMKMKQNILRLETVQTYI